MNLSLTAIVVDAHEPNRHEMSAFLLVHGVQVVAQLASAELLTEHLLRPDAPQLVLVNLDPSPHKALHRVGQLVRQFPAVQFFALSQAVDAELVMEAMHLGVREFVPLPVREEKLAAGIERVTRQHGLQRQAKILQVIPTAGGCGSTTVACNIAACLARSAKTVLLDLDLVRGGVAGAFNLRPRYTIADVMDSAEKLDKQLLDSALTVHTPSNLAVLARPDRPEDAAKIHPVGVKRLLGVLGRTFDYVVIDSILSVDSVSTTAVQAADEIILVMQVNVPSAKNAERFIGALRRLGVEQQQITLIANRYARNACNVNPQEIERMLDMKIAWLLPEDTRNAVAASDFGEPLVLRSPRAGISTSLHHLAHRFNGKSSHTN